MDTVYLSENIVIKGGAMYHSDKLIKRHNWHIKLADLGWEKLHKIWITKLNKLHNPYPNNSLFGTLECGDDGDCLFHCISHALNSVADDYYDAQDIRNKIADSITQEQFNNIITCYRCMKDLDDFDESWDPYEIDTLSKFKEELQKSGHSYWGDHTILQLIMNTFNLNIFVMTQDEINDSYEPYPMANIYDPNKQTIILLHLNESHFKLLGHYNKIMMYIFDNKTVPLEIRRLFKFE